jgi:hypothetical protein
MRVIAARGSSDVTGAVLAPFPRPVVPKVGEV